jgi:hydrogenase maturation protease
MMRTLVLGLGNPILSDDGVGVRVAERVRDALPDNSSVEVSEACVGGLSLMERMVGYDRVILIDAMCVDPPHPGAVRRLSLEDLRSVSPTQHIASAHDTNLLTALDTGRRMSLALPEQITLFAIEAVNVLDFGEELTPEVAQAVPDAVRAVLAELECLEPLPYSNEGGSVHDLT